MTSLFSRRIPSSASSPTVEARKNFLSFMRDEKMQWSEMHLFLYYEDHIPHLSDRFICTEALAKALKYNNFVAVRFIVKKFLMKNASTYKLLKAGELLIEYFDRLSDELINFCILHHFSLIPTLSNKLPEKTLLGIAIERRRFQVAKYILLFWEEFYKTLNEKTPHQSCFFHLFSSGSTCTSCGVMLPPQVKSTLVLQRKNIKNELEKFVQQEYSGVPFTSRTTLDIRESTGFIKRLAISLRKISDVLQEDRLYLQDCLWKLIQSVEHDPSNVHSLFQDSLKDVKWNGGHIGKLLHKYELRSIPLGADDINRENLSQENYLTWYIQRNLNLSSGEGIFNQDIISYLISRSPSLLLALTGKENKESAWIILIQKCNLSCTKELIKHLLEKYSPLGLAGKCISRVQGESISPFLLVAESDPLDEEKAKFWYSYCHKKLERQDFQQELKIILQDALIKKDIKRINFYLQWFDFTCLDDAMVERCRQLVTQLKSIDDLSIFIQRIQVIFEDRLLKTSKNYRQEISVLEYLKKVYATSSTSDRTMTGTDGNPSNRSSTTALSCWNYCLSYYGCTDIYSQRYLLVDRTRFGSLKRILDTVTRISSDGIEHVISEPILNSISLTIGIYWMRNLAQGLHSLHVANVFGVNLDCATIFVDENLRLKFSDFVAAIFVPVAVESQDISPADHPKQWSDIAFLLELCKWILSKCDGPEGQIYQTMRLLDEPDRRCARSWFSLLSDLQVQFANPSDLEALKGQTIESLHVHQSAENRIIFHSIGSPHDDDDHHDFPDYEIPVASLTRNQDSLLETAWAASAAFPSESVRVVDEDISFTGTVDDEEEEAESLGWVLDAEEIEINHDVDVVEQLEVNNSANLSSGAAERSDGSVNVCALTNAVESEFSHGTESVTLSSSTLRSSMPSASAPPPPSTPDSALTRPTHQVITQTVSKHVHSVVPIEGMRSLFQLLTEAEYRLGNLYYLSTQEQDITEEAKFEATMKAQSCFEACVHKAYPYGYLGLYELANDPKKQLKYLFRAAKGGIVDAWMKLATIFEENENLCREYCDEDELLALQDFYNNRHRGTSNPTNLSSSFIQFNGGICLHVTTDNTCSFCATDSPFIHLSHLKHIRLTKRNIDSGAFGEISLGLLDVTRLQPLVASDDDGAYSYSRLPFAKSQKLTVALKAADSAREAFDPNELRNEMIRMRLLQSSDYVVRCFGHTRLLDDILVHNLDGTFSTRKEPTQYVVMEYAPYHNLGDVVKEIANMNMNRHENDLIVPLWLIIRWLLDIACGIRDMHGYWLKHLDIKPGNCVVFASNPGASEKEVLQTSLRVKITDFGLSRKHSMSISSTMSSHRDRGEVPTMRDVPQQASANTNNVHSSSQPLSALSNYFTPGYAAPEVLMNYQTTLASDVFSFGMTAVHLINGETPNREWGTSYSQAQSKLEAIKMMEHHIAHIHVIEQLRNLIERCCKKEISQRPKIKECVKILEDLLQQNCWNDIALAKMLVDIEGNINKTNMNNITRDKAQQHSTERGRSWFNVFF